MDTTEQNEVVTIKLIRPKPFEGGMLTEISIREPIVDDIVTAKETKGNEGVQEVALIAKLSGLPTSIIRQLSMPDYKKIQEILQDFFG
jgi:hypothetical protein